MSDLFSDLFSYLTDFNQNGPGRFSQMNRIDATVALNRPTVNQSATLQIIQLPHERGRFDADSRGQVLLAQGVARLFQLKQGMPARLGQIGVPESLVDAVTPSTAGQGDGATERRIGSHDRERDSLQMLSMQSISLLMFSRVGPDARRDVDEIAFAQWFGLSRGRARMLTTLWRAQGQVVPAWSFGLDRRSVYVYVCDLRTALNPGGIHTRSKSGYALTASGLSECRAALLAMSAWWASEAAAPRNIAA